MQLAPLAIKGVALVITKAEIIEFIHEGRFKPHDISGAPTATATANQPPSISAAHNQPKE